MSFKAYIADLIGKDVVTRDITHNGVTKQFHFRVLKGTDVDNIELALIGEDNKVDRDKLVGNSGRKIAASLCNENGGQFATAAEVNELPAALRKKLLTVVNELNGEGEKKEDSTEGNGSGTS